MNEQMYSAKIDLNKIDESRLFNGKNGARYLDITLIPSRNSQYGDSHMIVQSVSKEERLAGKKGPIVGNAKALGGSRQPEPQRNAPAPRREAPKPPHDNNLDEDVPF